MKKNRQGILFVLSGPSGAGKGTLRAKLFEMVEGLHYSISCTTREPRKGEVDGRDYRFISEAEFEAHEARGDFLECAHVHGHRYGTLLSDVRQVLDRGEDIFLEIDVQGALQVKKKMPQAVTLFVVPPSLEVLEQRLRNRNTETEEELQLRLRNAIQELQLRDRYEFVVVNDAVEDAARELSAFVEKRRCETLREEL